MYAPPFRVKSKLALDSANHMAAHTYSTYSPDSSEAHQVYMKLVRQYIDNGVLPTTLYKFTRINDHFKNVIPGGLLHFSSPSEFNDPFDCKIYPDANFTEQDVLLHMMRIEGIQPTDIEMVLQLGRQRGSSNMHAAMTEFLWQDASERGVSCFSAPSKVGKQTKANLLLWAHYANKHEGVCLTFDINRDLDAFIIPFPVYYQEDYPKLAVFKDKSINYLRLQMLLHKSSEWSYENEVRVIKPSPALYSFRKEALREVIFGCRASKKDIDQIMGDARAKGSGFDHVKFYKAKQKLSTYDLDFELLP
jgi:Protein of unknown function (DUF2971)